MSTVKKNVLIGAAAVVGVLVTPFGLSAALVGKSYSKLQQIRNEHLLNSKEMENNHEMRVILEDKVKYCKNKKFNAIAFPFISLPRLAIAYTSEREGEGQKNKNVQKLCKKYNVNYSEYINFIQEGTTDDQSSRKNANTPIIRAVLQKNVNMVRLLKELGADINQPSNRGLTPLFLAIFNKDTEMVRVLNELGVDINQSTINGVSPITIAVNNNDMNMVMLLKELGVDINRSADSGETPMVTAVRGHHIGMVKLLKALGANINQVASCGDTPMTAAVYSNNINMVQLLAQLGADINKPSNKDNMHYTPLIVAILKNNKDIINLLKNLGADYQHAKEVLRRKSFAHIWGLKGSSQLTDKVGNTTTFSLEGLEFSFTTRLLCSHIKRFFISNNSILKENFISKESQAEIEEAFEAATSNAQSPAEILARIKPDPPNHPKPVVILGGSADHAISIVIYKNQLIVCNRGDGKDGDAVKFYDLPSSRIDETMITKLMSKMSHPNAESFNQMIASLQLNYLRGYDQKAQKIGNCTWISAKAAFGVLCRLYANEESQGKQVYKAFGKFASKQSLILYLSESDQWDIEMISQIGLIHDGQVSLDSLNHLLGECEQETKNEIIAKFDKYGIRMKVS